MKRSKSRTAVALSMRAKFKDDEHVELVIVDSITNEIYEFKFPFRKVTGFTVIQPETEVHKVGSEEDVADGK